MNEKQKIELGTANGFLRLYNQQFGASFRVSEQSDAPDIRCLDDSGRKLNLEITATEDAPGDIKALLGRSNHRSIEALVEHNERVAKGLESPQFSSLEGVAETLSQRIAAKLNNTYGKNTALVVRDTSGCDWEWDEVVPQIASQLDLSRNPFDEGIWLLTRVKDKLFEIVGPRK